MIPIQTVHSQLRTVFTENAHDCPSDVPRMRLEYDPLVFDSHESEAVDVSRKSDRRVHLVPHGQSVCGADVAIGIGLNYEFALSP
jgi:hypothetical protein